MGEYDEYFLDMEDGNIITVLDNDTVADLHPSINKLINYVWDKAADRDRPKRSDFDPKAVQSLLPYLAILDIIYADGVFEDAKFRLHGTGLVSVYGELTGVKISEHPSETVAARVYDDFNLVIDTKKIVIGSASSLDDEKSHIKLKKVNIPFFDDSDDKDKVTQIVTLIQFNY